MRTERVTVWLTPEERERLRLLALAEDMTDSSIGRQAVLSHLARSARLVEQARIFRQGLVGSA